MRKWIWVMLTVMLMLSISGCGKKQEEAEEDTSSMVYEGNALAVNGMEGEPELYCVKGGTLYLLSAKWTEDEIPSDEEQSAGIQKGTEAEFYFYKVEIDGGSLEEIPLELSEKECIKAFYVEDDGSIVHMISGAEGIELLRQDESGKELLRENLTSSLGLSEDDAVCRVVADNSGNLFVASNQTIYMLSENFQLTGEVKLREEQLLVDMARTKDGQIVYAQNANRSNGYTTVEVCILDTERKKAGNALKGIQNCSSEGNCLLDGAEYDFYLKNRFGIYGYNIDEKKENKLLDAGSSYLTSADVTGMVYAGDNRFVGALYDNEHGEETFSMELYTWLEPEVVRAKQTITYADYAVSDSLIKAAREFNRENKDYKIEFKVYEIGDSDGEDYHQGLYMDIATGNVPDIICMSALPISVEQCVSKGLLADLTPYYEKDDKVNMDAFIPSVLEGMKIDGKLYYLAPYFSINTVAGRTSDVGSESGWTFDEMKAALEKKGDDVLPFYNEEKEMMLSDFLFSGLTDFVDWQTGECNFDSEAFRDILLLCNRGLKEMEYTDEEFSEYLDDLNLLFTNGKVLLEAEQGVSLTDVQNIHQRFGEDITFIGFPNKEREGSYFQFDSATGIYSQSKVKDKAWEFIRLLGEKEYQYEIYRKYPQYYGTPTRQDCFDMRIRAVTAKERYIDEFGDEVVPIEKESFTFGSNEVKVGPVSQEDVELYLDLINRTKKSMAYDGDILDIVWEEAQAYFAGDKDLDETVQVIQKRVETYVNESK
ncbi:MAG: extracellular solute-binding protein [Bacteroidales bacterium]|nr:extracellular solute-binding protein [Clostridium sp.]MCM1203563.1 extracellular solute-binding protein [Bacteroidales bacterium]